MIEIKKMGLFENSYRVKEGGFMIGVIGEGLRGEGYVFSPRVDVEMEEYLTFDAICAIKDKMEELSDDN